MAGLNERGARAGEGGVLPPAGRGAVVVAHPDDETLWAGGVVLMHPRWDWTVVTLCRASDADRAPRFRRALQRLGAAGAMGDLDDGPEQTPLADEEVRGAVLSLLPDTRFDLVLTHGPDGEYTRHRRHEEVSEAVGALCAAGGLCAGALWLFAYEDAGGRRLPRPRRDAHCRIALADDVWRAKRSIVTETYGFGPDSFEARAAPRTEAFWCFGCAADYEAWCAERGKGA